MDKHTNIGISWASVRAKNIIMSIATQTSETLWRLVRVIAMKLLMLDCLMSQIELLMLAMTLLTPQYLTPGSSRYHLNSHLSSWHLCGPLKNHPESTKNISFFMTCLSDPWEIDFYDAAIKQILACVQVGSGWLDWNLIFISPKCVPSMIFYICHSSFLISFSAS